MPPPYSPTYTPLSTFPQYIPSLISPLHIPSSTLTPYIHSHFWFHISSVVLPWTFPLQHFPHYIPSSTLPYYTPSLSFHPSHSLFNLPHYIPSFTFPHTTLPYQHFLFNIKTHYILFNIPLLHSLTTLQHPFTVSPSWSAHAVQGTTWEDLTHLEKTTKESKFMVIKSPVSQDISHTQISRSVLFSWHSNIRMLHPS